MSTKIWVYTEVDDGHAADVSLELLGKASLLAESVGDAVVEAVLVGDDALNLVPDLARAGADTVHLACDPRLKQWSPLTYVPLLAGLVQKHRPGIFLFGATAQGSCIGPGLAARLKTGMAAHCLDLRIDAEGCLISSVPAFGGKVVGEILCPHTSPQMASVKPGIFSGVAALPGEGTVVAADLSCLDDLDVSALTPLGVRREQPVGIPLHQAQFVACGGFGLGAANWHALEELSALLGGAVACTRPPVDEGWARESSMVGTSGRSIRPKCYMGFGISGATHHICGMNGSGFVVSVNSDPDAPIFAVSDVKIVADGGAVLNALVRLLK